MDPSTIIDLGRFYLLGGLGVALFFFVVLREPRRAKPGLEGILLRLLLLPGAVLLWPLLVTRLLQARKLRRTSS